MNWVCVKCSKCLEEGQVQVRYLGNVFSIKMLTCPQCGIGMVNEDMAMNTMADAEKILEDK